MNHIMGDFDQTNPIECDANEVYDNRDSSQFGFVFLNCNYYCSNILTNLIVA